MTGEYNFVMIKNFFAILFCLGIVFGFTVLAEANPDAKVQFTQDTEIDLSGLDTALYALKDSECDSLSVSGSTLTVEIPDGSTFILGASDHKVLGLTPSGGTITLIFDSADFFSGYISQWQEENAVSNLKVSYLIGVSKTNAWYTIKADGALFDSFESNSSGEIAFTYEGGVLGETINLEIAETEASETLPKTGSSVVITLLIAFLLSSAIYLIFLKLHSKRT